VTAIDFFEKEVKRLQERFNATIGQEPTMNMRARHLAIMAICWADILARSVRETSDKKKIGEMTREFCNVREGLNRFFDLIEPQPERREHGNEEGKHSAAAGG
jgi:hypothetical protein